MICEKCESPMKELGRRPAFDVSSGTTASTPIAVTTRTEYKGDSSKDWLISDKKLRTYICTNSQCGHKKQIWD
jgi:hypothetical protein